MAIANIVFAQVQTNQTEVFLRKGEIQLNQYNFENALEEANKALKTLKSAKRRSPAKLTPVYFLLGKIYEKGFYFDKAIEEYTNALEFATKKSVIYKRRGDIYRYIGETEKADADINNVDQKDLSYRTVGKSDFGPAMKDPDVFQIIGFKDVLNDSDEPVIKDENNDGIISNEEIMTSYILYLRNLNKLVRFNPGSDLALWKRADLYLQINELSNQLFWLSAVSDFTSAFEIHPRFEYLVNRGVVRAERKNKANYEFAINDFSYAIQINKRSVEAFYNRGLCSLKLNENKNAIADFTQVIMLDPGFAIAYKSRAKAFRLIGKTEEAEADEQKIKRLEE